MVLLDDFTNRLYRNTELPSLLWRTGSYSTIVGIHAVCRIALYGFNKTEVHGLPAFLDLLKSRADYRTRTKGLVTVSNHISVIDDPVIWGVLPLSFTALHGYQSNRWSFASHDLCFNNTPLSHFFTLGQTLPTHRMKHSQHGGLFQPTFTEGVRLLSRIDANAFSWSPHCIEVAGATPYANTTQSSVDLGPTQRSPSWPKDATDPLSPLRSHLLLPPAYPSSPNDVRLYNAPSRYASNSYSWLHIFPEGVVHQTDEKERYVRYFKWGVSRLILEPPEAPDFVPMFIEGTDQIMHESRTFPRFLPRIGNKVSVTFGHHVDVEAVFGDLRGRWREICDRENAKLLKTPDMKSIHQGRWRNMSEEETDLTRDIVLDDLYQTQLGIIGESLKYDAEVVELRKECTRRVREEVLKVRRARGYPDEDPKAGIADTWRLEGAQREGKMEDDSWIKET